ncbi:MAG: HAMP domain-containing sensor histidine kinase, partial [Betaproteobacteria bacterium]
NSESFILRVGPHQTNHLTLYEIKNDQWKTQIAGDRHPRLNKLCPDHMHCFALQAQEPDSPYFYLSLSNNGVVLVETELTTPSSLIDSVTAYTKRASSSAAIALGILIFALVFCIIERSFLLMIYCFMQFTVVLFIIASSGVLIDFFTTAEPSTIDDFSACIHTLRVLMTIILGWAAIKNYMPSQSYQISILSLVIICVINIILIAIDTSYYQPFISYVLFSINPLIQFYGIYRAQKIPKSIKLILTISYSAYMIVVVLASLVAFGILNYMNNPIQSFIDWRLNGLPIGIIIFWIVHKEQSRHKLQQVIELQNLRVQSIQTKLTEEALIERSTLIDMLTHELKNPLATMSFALASIRKKLLGEDAVTAHLQHIDSSIRRMNSLIEHVAQSNKIDSIDTVNSIEKISAEEFIQELINEYPDPNRFTLIVENDIFLNADRQLLTIVLVNLINNAYKYAGTNQVWIEVKQSSVSTSDDPRSPVVICKIINHIDEADFPDESHLFERYYRHANFQKIPGMGLGLSLAQTAAKKLNATLNYIKSSQTVTFEVRFFQ